jgi:hypothetical protein
MLKLCQGDKPAYKKYVQFTMKCAISVHSITETESMQIRVISQHRSLMLGKLIFFLSEAIKLGEHRAQQIIDATLTSFDTCSSLLTTKAFPLSLYFTFKFVW